MSALRRRVGVLSRRFSASPRRCSENSFSTYSVAPRARTRCSVSAVPAPVRMITGIMGSRLRTCRKTGEPIHPRHFEIEHKDIGAFSAKALQTLLATFRDDHVIALPPEECVKESTDALLIINHENLGHTSPESNSEANQLKRISK